MLIVAVKRATCTSGDPVSPSWVLFVAMISSFCSFKRAIDTTGRAQTFTVLAQSRVLRVLDLTCWFALVYTAGGAKVNRNVDLRWISAYIMCEAMRFCRSPISSDGSGFGRSRITLVAAERVHTDSVA